MRLLKGNLSSTNIGKFIYDNFYWYIDINWNLVRKENTNGKNKYHL